MLENVKVKRGEDYSTNEILQVPDDQLIDIYGLPLNKKELKNHVLNSFKYSELKRQLTEEA